MSRTLKIEKLEETIAHNKLMIKAERSFSNPDKKAISKFNQRIRRATKAIEQV